MSTYIYWTGLVYNINAKTWGWYNGVSTDPITNLV